MRGLLPGVLGRGHGPDMFETAEHMEVCEGLVHLWSDKLTDTIAVHCSDQVTLWQRQAEIQQCSTQIHIFNCFYFKILLNNVFVHFTLSDEDVPFFTLFKVKGFGISISCLSLGCFCNIQISCKSACVVVCRVIGGYISYKKGIR